MFTQLSYKTLRADARNIPLAVTNQILLARKKQDSFSFLDQMPWNKMQKRERKAEEILEPKKMVRQIKAVSFNLVNKPKQKISVA